MFKKIKSRTKSGKEYERNYAGFWQNTVLGEWTPEVLEILARVGITQPTKRRVFYTLTQRFPDFPRTKEAYKELIHNISEAQFKWGRYKNWDGFDYRLGMFRDDNRPDVLLPEYKRPKWFVQDYVIRIRNVLDNYDMPYWEGQKNHVENVIEKQSMEESFKRVAKGLQVVVIPNKGDDSNEHLHKQYVRWKRIQQEEGKNVHIKFYSDLDMYGEHMDKNLKDKILRMIELDVENGEEPLNWDWSEKEDWNNAEECLKDIGAERVALWRDKILGKNREYKDDPERKSKLVDKLKSLSKASWHTKHYDPDKPGFSFKRVGLTMRQADELGLTKLDSTPIDELDPNDGKYKSKKEFAATHGQFFAVELDAMMIQNEDEFVEMITDAVEEHHDKEIWERVKPTLSPEIKDKEVRKRIKFTKLSDKEYELWKKDELEEEEEEEE